MILGAALPAGGEEDGSDQATGERAEPAPAAELRCIEVAELQTLLDEDQVERLCNGARGIEPVVCFLEARGEALLEQDAAIDLCRCATTIEPVVCFLDARDIYPSEAQQALRRCSPIAVQRLADDCRPIVPTPPSPDEPGGGP